jgi:hypothetical protein
VEESGFMLIHVIPPLRIHFIPVNLLAGFIIKKAYPKKLGNMTNFGNSIHPK